MQTNSTIKAFEQWADPAGQVEEDEIFIWQDGSNHWWVESWDGYESHPIGDRLEGKADAIAAAREAIAAGGK